MSTSEQQPKRKWAEIPREERARRWQGVTEETHGSWLANVVREMVEHGIGWGSAAARVSDRERQDGGQ